MPSILDRLIGVFRPEKQAATALAPLPEPKVPNKQQSQQSFSKRTATTSGDVKLSSTDRRTANLDLTTLRNGLTTKKTIRDLAQVSPDLSASVWAYQRLVVTRGFMAVARAQDGTAEPAATSALQQVISRMNYLADYSEGFSNVSGLHSCAEMLTKELRLEGSCAMELVLDKSRLPSRFQPISTSQIEFYEDNKGLLYPLQKAAKGDIALDQPTFFYESVDQDLLTAYSDSPMEAALQAVLADTEFTNDVRRVIKRALHPRLDVKIDTDKFNKSVPLELRGDSEATRLYQENFISSVESTVNGLEPDDALVHFDSVEFDYLNNGNVTLDKEYQTLQGMVNSKLATGTKAPPAVLGHGSGSQNVASTETMLFVRYCEGLQLKLNSIFSRALTLSMRLMGFDVYVEFSFDRIDLRPDAELEAFRAQKQSRVLDLLSLGLISDEEAALQLTGKLPSKATTLSGTFFRTTAGADPNAEAAAMAGAGSSGTSALTKDIQPSTPSQKRGAPVTRVK